MNTYFIIESEDAVLENITNVFGESDKLSFNGISSNYETALNSILKKRPTIVFLNIDNIVTNMTEFVSDLNQYSDSVPLLIAISSSKDKAYDAIKLNFFDYLINPLSELNIRKAMMKIEKHITTQDNTTVCLKSYKDYHYLNTNEILFLKADNNTTDFHMKDGNIISAFKTLKTYEESLPSSFLRIHKSYIINSSYVSRINYGKLICTLNSNNYNIPFTKTYLNNVESINNVLSGLVTKN